MSQCYIIINIVCLHLLDYKLNYIATQTIHKIYLKIDDYGTNCHVSPAASELNLL